MSEQHQRKNRRRHRSPKSQKKTSPTTDFSPPRTDLNFVSPPRPESSSSLNTTSSEPRRRTTSTTSSAQGADEDKIEKSCEESPLFSDDEIENSGKVVIDLNVNVHCAPLAILFKFNLLEPKRWEEMSKMVVFGDGRQQVESFFYVELGHVLMRVALVSGIKTTFFSVKQANEQGIDIIVTSDRRLILRGLKTLGMESGVDEMTQIFLRTPGGDFVQRDNNNCVELWEVEPTLASDGLLFHDSRTKEIVRQRERV